MVIRLEKIGDLQMVRLAGRLLLPDGVAAFARVLADLMEHQPRRVLLILDGITHIDSSGIGELVTAFTKVKAYGGQLRLVSPTAHVWRVLQTTKLDRVIPCLDTLEQALESFDGKPVEMVV